MTMRATEGPCGRGSVRSLGKNKGLAMSSPFWRWIPLACILVTGFLAGCSSSDEQGSQSGRGQGIAQDKGSRSGREKGIREARAAIAEGKLKLKEYPPTPSPPGHGEYTALFRERCGVEYEVISTPDFSEELKQEVWGWNEMMRAEIERKFGPDIFQQLNEEAKERWQNRLSPESKE